jgi:hypothetical protein
MLDGCRLSLGMAVGQAGALMMLEGGFLNLAWEHNPIEGEGLGADLPPSIETAGG